MSTYLIPGELLQATVDYLQGCAYKDVAGLLGRLGGLEIAGPAVPTPPLPMKGESPTGPGGEV